VYKDILARRIYKGKLVIWAYYTNTEGLGLIRQFTCVWEEIAFLSTFKSGSSVSIFAFTSFRSRDLMSCDSTSH
jgi:hypothetical protein